MERKPQKRLKKVSPDEIGRLTQAVAHHCGTSPTAINFIAGQVRRTVEVLEEIH